MSNNNIIDHPNQMVIPGDDGQPIVALNFKRPRQRSHVNKDGRDWMVMQLAPRGSEFPDGTMLPIPSMPRYPNAETAKRDLPNHKSELVGLQVAVVKVGAIARIEPVQEPAARVVFKRTYRPDEVQDLKSAKNAENWGPSSQTGTSDGPDTDLAASPR